ncbi:MAG TPA: SAM-dependent chlorinase/fluorinase [Pyrinomonadaceae bacterium]|nr:SAM-dependent chlorinase/fluorinase [Pyrinomonadaceae bacterium]
MLVTLLTDFGTADYFVGAMKGAVLASNPRAQVVDITHEIPAHDIEAGAFTLLAAFEAFPAGTVHVAVVDPGVGSARRAVAVTTPGHTFVGPDNGVFGYVYERVESFAVHQLTNQNYFRKDVSTTFHGRDVFAPVAGALSRGVAVEELGPRVEDFVRLPFARPERRAGGVLEGRIIHVDRFGNCVTNFTRRDVPAELFERGMRMKVGGFEIEQLRRFFADEREARGGPFAIWGSAGLLEIAVNRDSAARRLGVERGQPVEVFDA